MRCEACQGTGYTQQHVYAGSVFEPCKDCQGQGIAYCCDDAGVRGQVNETPSTGKDDGGF
jgi:DnaJ-class molecular chaperone